MTHTTPLTLATYATPAGEAHAVVTPEDGAIRLFGWLDPAPNLARLSPDLLERGIEEARGPQEVRDAVEHYGDGDLTALATLTATQPGGEFRQRVWAALRRIPAGHPVSYTELAAAAGRPTAVRAAASGCATNLVALVVPCHRALRRDGSLGGFYYGLAIKRLLLAHEERHAVAG